ncbi:hypothetical protein [Mucilaginibacter flavus]|uniref:hypothetical protein n=1 Tax=Mucilaginibacter flavus TaxID=931504 RepID=UPI0025B54611|nr:hypothetical protein [Mucilaginibacter flavus]MDN3584252.1 hypothetical protein [Mucilaginibacter flavus]
MIKIKYEISTKTQIQSKIIKERFLEQLNKKNSYQIMENYPNIVKFRNNIWRVGSRMNSFGTVDGGILEIQNGEENTVRFSYYISSVFDFLMVVFFLFASFFVDYHIVFLILPILIIFIFRIINVKSIGREMFNNILLNNAA